MNPNNVFLYYLNRRQLGYDGIRKNVNEMVIDNIGYKYSNRAPHFPIGNTFACKFSRNSNNLHVLGCSTELGEMVIQSTLSDCEIINGPIKRNVLHNNAIFNFAWAEPEMKLVTACGDHTSKLFLVSPSGTLEGIRIFSQNASVKSVMFRPGSSDVFCAGGHDGSVKIWDARINNDQNVLEFDCNIPNAHASYGLRRKRPMKVYGVSCVLYTDEQTVVSCSILDGDIKVWDLRKSYRNVRACDEPLPLMKFHHGDKPRSVFVGFMDMITNPQKTHLYASGVNNVIYCYSLGSTNNEAICEFSGHNCETNYSKISISNDGRYLFSGCSEKAGVIWDTSFPYKKEPVLTMMTKTLIANELSSSDWCGDPACMKLATSSDSLPNLWTVHPSTEEDLETRTLRSSSRRLKLPPKVYTAPIKLDAKLKKIYGKETEKNMEDWDTTTQIKEKNVCELSITPKKPWKKSLFSNASTCNEESPQQSNRSQQSSPVTPTSNRKRKKSSVSPKNLIDHYFSVNNKREKLDSVNENE